MYNTIDLCLKFYATFSPIEAEIISYLIQQEDFAFCGTYTALTVELGRDSGKTGTGSNIRKALLNLAERKFLVLDNVVVYGKNNKPHKERYIALAENFEELLMMQSYSVEQIRSKQSKKHCTDSKGKIEEV